MVRLCVCIVVVAVVLDHLNTPSARRCCCCCFSYGVILWCCCCCSFAKVSADEVPLNMLDTMIEITCEEIVSLQVVERTINELERI